MRGRSKDCVSKQNSGPFFGVGTWVLWQPKGAAVCLIAETITSNKHFFLQIWATLVLLASLSGSSKQEELCSSIIP
jgi:hypothetical protein